MNKNIKIIRKSDSKSFVGIVIEEGCIEIHVPLFFRCSDKLDKNDKNEIIKLLKSINIAKSYEKEIAEFSNEKNNGEFWPIKSYLWIVKDYIKNGVYYPRKRVYKENAPGKISWKRTIKKMPLISKHGFVYSNIISSQIESNSNDITQIYKFCLNIVSERIGWLLNVNIYFNDSCYLSVKEMYHIISKALKNTFDEVKKKRLKAMLSILANVNDDTRNSKYHTYGIYNYYYVYERMIDQLFHGIDENEKLRYNPPTFWHIKGHNNKKAPLEPDTICLRMNGNKRTTYILDSKYYEYGKTNGDKIDELPGTQSIQKQITYGDYVMKKIDAVDKKKGIISNDSFIRNIFILPFNCENNHFDTNDNIVYIGYATADWRRGKLYDHDFILAYLIDFNYVLDHYDKHVDCDFFFDMVDNQIQEINSQHDS